jgi:hypothetical protein
VTVIIFKTSFMKKNTSSQNRMDLIDRNYPNSTTRENWLKMHNHDSDIDDLMVIPETTEASRFGSPSRWGPAIKDTKIKELAQVIGKSTTLKVLSLDPNFHDETGPSMLHVAPTTLGEDDIGRTRLNFQLLCEGFHNNESIEKLILHGTTIQFLMQFLTPFVMQGNNVLQEITLSKCQLSHENMQLFATSLISRGIPLDKLTLENVEDGVNELALTFHDNPGLFPKKFYATLLNRIIGLDECTSMAHLLQDSRCTMEELSIMPSNMSEFRIDDDRPIVIANALAGNETLYKLDLGYFIPSRVLVRAFLWTMCNPSTINSTYTSNHTLFLLDFHFAFGDSALSQYLHMNSDDDKKAVACHKVLKRHFSDFYGNFSWMEFKGMEPELLMRSLIFFDKWGSEYNYGVRARRSILFHLIKSAPMIVVPQTEVAQDTEISRPSKRIRASGCVSANKQDMEEKMKLQDEQSRLQIEEIRVLKEEQTMMARELKKSKESEKLLAKEMDLLNEQNGELQANFKNLAKELEIANNALLDSAKVKEELQATIDNFNNTLH